jgi:two-component system response regulator MprA
MNTLAPKSILVVDDEPSVANTLRMLLRMDGHRVEVAADGEKALAKYREDRFDLVITDLLMPGKDGLELARLIKALVPQQPILLITGHLEALCDNEKALLPDIDGLLGKPFSQEELREALKAAFPHG